MFEEQTISSDKIYAGKNISLRIDTVEANNKGYQKREIVEHNGAVCVVAVDENKKIVLVKQYRKSIEKVLLELPAGKIEMGENPKDTALRELKEETGYIAKDLKLIHKYFSAPGFTNQKVYIYLATNLEKSFAEPQNGEYIETEIMEFNKVYEMVINNELEDAKSNLGILLSKELIGNI